MKIVKEEYFEDEEGKKKKIIFKNGLEEISLLEPSQYYIDTQINPRIEKSNKFREKEKKYQEKLARFQQWLEENFGEEKKISGEK